MNAIESKKAEIADAKGWLEDLREIGAGREELARTRKAIELLEADLNKLERSEIT